jgi:hypothetical protein
MSIIYNYPQVTPQGSDLLVGTQVYDENNQPIKGNPTRNFTVSSVGNFVNQTYNLYEVPKQKIFTMTNAMIKAGAYIQTQMVAAPGSDKVLLPLEFSALVVNGSDATGVSGAPPIEAKIGNKVVGTVPNDVFSGVANSKTFYTRGIPQLGTVVPLNNPWVVRPTADFSAAGFNGEIKIILAYQIFDTATYQFVN